MLDKKHQEIYDELWFQFGMERGYNSKEVIPKFLEYHEEKEEPKSNAAVSRIATISTILKKLKAANVHDFEMQSSLCMGLKVWGRISSLVFSTIIILSLLKYNIPLWIFPVVGLIMFGSSLWHEHILTKLPNHSFLHQKKNLLQKLKELSLTNEMPLIDAYKIYIKEAFNGLDNTILTQSQAKYMIKTYENDRLKHSSILYAIIKSANRISSLLLIAIVLLSLSIPSLEPIRMYFLFASLGISILFMLIRGIFYLIAEARFKRHIKEDNNYKQIG